MDIVEEKKGQFYLGKNLKTQTPLHYRSKDLTTHAAIIGMTGSGKTGLGIALLEEAALANTPIIAIDPKGDMTNLALAFETMSAEEYLQWIDPSEASMQNKSVDELAQERSTTNLKGLAESLQDPTRLKRYRAVEKIIYTPGSSAGVGVDILGSFTAPPQETLDDTESFASYINAGVASLLALLGEESQDATSKEYLLLSTLLQHYYSQNISLDIEKLITNIITPPFAKIGMLELDDFYPQAERFKLATALNTLISSVSFAAWRKGEALNIQDMLYDADGKAKVCIFSIAHLSDEERMFFVTLLLNAYITWMRSLTGSSSLRSVLYMDEIFGFFPPSKNPPSKEPMLLLLKQARAFGCGIVLSTQNPVDLDYKGLANIGSWFIGKLQTTQDIERVLDGIAAKSTESKAQLKEIISRLKGREFFLKNTHDKEVQHFSTRWVLSYLKGPMSKEEIKRLMEHKQAPETLRTLQEQTQNDATKALVSKNIKEYFNPKSADSLLYPYLYAEAKVSYFDQKRGIDFTEEHFFKLLVDEAVLTLEWEEAHEESLQSKSTAFHNSIRFAPLSQLIKGVSSLKSFEKSLSDFLYQKSKLELLSQKELELESFVGESRGAFTTRVETELLKQQESMLQKAKESYQKESQKLEEKYQTLLLKRDKEQNEANAKTADTLISMGLTLVSAFFGKKGLSASTISKGASTLTKGKGMLKERSDVANVEAMIEDLTKKMQMLEASFEEEQTQIQERYVLENYPLTSLPLKAKRSDISVVDFALLWEG